MRSNAPLSCGFLEQDMAQFRLSGPADDRSPTVQPLCWKPNPSSDGRWRRRRRTLNCSARRQKPICSTGTTSRHRDPGAGATSATKLVYLLVDLATAHFERAEASSDPADFEAGLQYLGTRSALNRTILRRFLIARSSMNGFTLRPRYCRLGTVFES